jgi:hypothetical protein
MLLKNTGSNAWIAESNRVLLLPRRPAPAVSRTARHRADQGPVRNQRTGPSHTQTVGKPDDAMLGKINDGQHTTGCNDNPRPWHRTSR